MADQDENSDRMDRHQLSGFREINTIIERDSKDTTYKFALLRGVIDDHLKRFAFREELVFDWQP